MMDLAAGIAAGASALKVIKELREIDHAYDKAELKAKMAGLYEQVSEMRMTLADVREELRAKDEEIARLNSAMKSNSELVEVNGFKHEANAEGKPKGLPFCPKCLEVDNIRIRPARLLGNHYQCPNCKAMFSNLNEYRNG